MTTRARLGGITVGDGSPVAVAGVLNVSPESFYAGSIVTGEDDLLRAADAMIRAGAAFIDVGAMSTAPSRAGAVPESLEADRLGWAVERLVRKLGVTVSADTSRSVPAQAAADAGARIINDVRGLTADRRMAEVVARAGTGLILMASERGDLDRGPERRRDGVDPVGGVRARLEAGLRIAGAAGVDPAVIVVDPGIGFFRGQGMAWHEWDCAVLGALHRLSDLGRPICVGVSRKSFIGAVADQPDPERRLPGSLAAAAVAVLAGARVVRTHDVEETVQAVKVADAIRRGRGRA